MNTCYDDMIININDEDNGLENLEQCLKSGADPNLKNEYNQTCLFYAVKEEKFEATKILLENKANPNLRDKYSKVPLLKAAEVIKILLDVIYSLVCPHFQIILLN